MFSLESLHRGDSNEYTQYTFFIKKKKITSNYPKSADMGFFSKGLKNEFETTVVNELSVFEPLKFYSTVASRYLDPAYLDPITYVEPMSESRIFLLYIYCVLTSHVSNFF